MRKSSYLSVCISLLLMLTMYASATSYSITFSANGASSVLDQVEVNNLTQGTTVTVPGGSSLLLTAATDVPQLNINASLRISPNPIVSTSKVSFHSAKGGLTLINLLGMDGKIIKGLVMYLQAGENEFMLSLPKGVYALQINDKENIHAAKIISQGSNHTAIEFIGATTANENVVNKMNNSQKANSAIINMSYNEGDQLVFKASAGNYVSILGDVITANKSINFKMVECVDRDGKHYPVVTIGTQTWMAENLNTSRFRNNEAIADKTNDASWGSTTAAAYSDYASPDNNNAYGKLYNGYAVTDPNNLAPLGWNIPTDADWTILSDYLGGINTAGWKLKEMGNAHWMTENTDATNESGFAALPGGTKSTDGNINDVGSTGYWWSATNVSNTNNKWHRKLLNNSSSLFRNFANDYTGMSVRCVMSDLPQTPPASITSITPTCFYNSTVVIRGDNFSSTKTDNIVKFGTTRATVTYASRNTLYVTTPDFGAATTIDVTVTILGAISNKKSIDVEVDLHKFNTFDWTTHTVKPGVTYKSGLPNLFGSVRRIYILDVSLDATNQLGIGFSTANAATVTMCKNYGAVAGINAGYFPMSGAVDKDPYIRINGVTVQDGHLNVSQYFTNVTLRIHNNVASVKKNGSATSRNQNKDAAAIPVSTAENVIVCGPHILENNEIPSTLDMSKSHNYAKTARTGLGVTADGKKVFMVVVDSGGGFTGITALEMAKVMQALGAVDAMNFDGGGSSTMFVKDQGASGRVNFPYGGTTQRLVRSVIYVK